MSIRLRHAKVVAAADTNDGKVSSNAWNDQHVLTGTPDMLLGFDADGSAAEIDPSTITTGGLSSTVVPVADRTALAALSTLTPAYLKESGREGSFVWSSASLSAQVTADRDTQGIYVPPASDTSGASGAWVRQFDGPIEVDWFGPDGVDDTPAIHAACALASLIGKPHLRISSNLTCTAAIVLDEDDLDIEGRGATVTSAFDGKVVAFNGDRLKVRGLHIDMAATGADPAPYCEVNGANVEINGNTFTRAATAHIPFYVRSTATGLRFRNNNCTWYGGINMISNIVDCEITGNSFVNPGSASDDGIAIKAIGGVSESILIADNYFENMADFVGIGSEIGVLGTTDSTYSSIVRGVIITGNRGKNCTRMLMIKPGGVDGVDYRDGTVRGVIFSNNTLIDISGTAMLQPLYISPGRGARIYDVTGKNNKAIGRTLTGGSNPYGQYIRLRNDGTGTADCLIDKIDVGMEILDPYNGAAAGGASPGTPFSNAVHLEKASSAHGTATNVVIDVAANGTRNSGINIQAGFDDGVYIRRFVGTNINTDGSTSFGGISLSSRVMVGDDISISMSGGQAYKLNSGGDIVSHVDHVYVEKSIAAGTDSARAIRWAAPRKAFVHRVAIANSTNIAQSADDTNYTQHEVRNESASAANNSVSSKLTGGSALANGVFNTIYDAVNLSSTNLSDCFYSTGNRLSYTKNDFGTGNALTDAYLRISWAPY